MENLNPEEKRKIIMQIAISAILLVIVMVVGIILL